MLLGSIPHKVWKCRSSLEARRKNKNVGRKKTKFLDTNIVAGGDFLLLFPRAVYFGPAEMPLQSRSPLRNLAPGAAVGSVFCVETCLWARSCLYACGLWWCGDKPKKNKKKRGNFDPNFCRNKWLESESESESELELELGMFHQNFLLLELSNDSIRNLWKVLDLEI